MIAKYIGPTIKNRPGSPGLKKGQKYDVAEILEYPPYLMARDKPGDPWPVPGSARFGRDYSDFELRRRVPGRSCGYHRSISLNGCFGVVFTDERELVTLEEAERLLSADPPEPSEPFELWRKRSGFSGSDELAVYCFGMSALDCGEPEIGVHRDAINPEEYRAGVGKVGYFAEHMVYWNMSVDMASRNIKWLLAAIGLPEREPAMLNETLWLKAWGVRFFDAD
ncbi:MAG: hypothetical protein IPM64_16665 [Phycisphaerales bacterium]|nr:hypothetical protein [Phycisphaerales bacterium]